MAGARSGASSRAIATDLAAHPGLAYPERALAPDKWYERAWHDLRGRVTAPWTSRAARYGGIVELANSLEPVMRDASDAALARHARAAATRLRIDGLEAPAAAAVFAAVRECARRRIGLRHHDVQLLGGWIMLNGRIAEMHTGEGKTLTATLTAAAAALAGLKVHLVTVNDYLAQRDAETMRPVYEALGLQVAAIEHDMTPQAKREAYGSDVVYCSNKELAFDFLRDRIRIGRHGNRLSVRVNDLRGSLSGTGRLRDELMLRGLYFAIVDEADSVLVDEARTPLIISRDAESTQAGTLYEQALALASELVRDEDFTVDARRRRIDITARGRARLEGPGGELGGVWSGPRRREELITQALGALHLYECDVHYLVRDDTIQIVDEYTGRVLEGRSWERGLHQMIEAKEGVTVTGRRESLARTTYQGFFRRYLRLSGMTGTGAELRSELWSVYGLEVVPVPTHRPCRRRMLGTRICADEQRKWHHVAERVEAMRRAGQPVLIGTRSVAASEAVSERLDQAAIDHRVLNARQDAGEAAVVAEAGRHGAVTVATNMAGRGTDISLEKSAAEAGGLHVLATGLHDARRIDRQLYGRSARQGDAGSCEAVLSLDDELVESFGSRSTVRALRALLAMGTGQWLAARYLRSVQARAERYHAGVRRDLIRNDEKLEESLAFSGKGQS